MNQNISRLLTFFLLAGVLIDPALASTSGAALPWEGAIKILGESLTSVGFWIGVIGFIVAGAILVFGNDMSDLGRRSVLAVLAISVILLAQDFIKAIWPSAGALI